MNFQEYIDNQFVIDLKTIERKIGSKEEDAIYIDNYCYYFRIEHASHLHLELESINQEHRAYFFLAIFIYSIIDISLFSYFGAYYFRYKRLVKYPRFNWTGFEGEAYYSTIISLWDSVQQQELLSENELKGLLPEYKTTLKEKLIYYFDEKIMEVSSANFLRCLINDQDLLLEDKNEDNYFYILCMAIRDLA